MFIKNCWYVAAWGNEVASEGLLARTITGVPLVFWRDAAGDVVALHDRCCHRAAALSLGRKEGADCIRCMYHGLVFDRRGECVQAPGQQKLPPNARVRSFPVRERHRWVWVWMGDAELADDSLIPPTPWLDDPGWRSLDGYIHYDANYLLIADNLLDFSHLPFLHPATLGGSPDYAAVRPKVERFDRGLRLSKHVLNTAAPAYAAAYAPFPTEPAVDRWMDYEFLLPGVLLLDSGLISAGGDISSRDPSQALSFRGCQALAPETERSTHYFFAHAHNFLLDQPAVTQAIHAGVVQAFEEDREMIMRQQRNLELEPSLPMMPLGIDAALNQFRWLVERAIKQEQRVFP